MFNKLKILSKEQKTKFIKSLAPEELTMIYYNWREIWARPSQIEPEGDWTYWLILAGRGWGKTKTASEWIRERVYSGEAKHLAFVAPRSADIRDVMIEGASGLLDVFPPNQRPIYEPSKRRVTFHTGAVAITYSGDEPDQLRGPNVDTVWIDELASARLQKEIMDMIAFCLRIGSNPRCIITTTPRPTPTIKGLAKQANVHITRGTTFENRENLSPVFFDSIIGKYERSRIGRQELYGEILEDNPKALWNSAEIDSHRVDKHPILRRIVIGVDPAVTANKKSDETGIIAVGKGTDDHYYVLEDKSCRESPARWGKIVCNLYGKLEADKVIGEVNQGGDMVGHVINTIDPLVNFKSVRATRGKKVRAEPVAALFEQGKVHMVGVFPDLETQMVEWNPEEDGDSPDRIDSMVYAIMDLMGKGKRTLTNYNPEGITDFSRQSPHLPDHIASDPKRESF